MVGRMLILLLCVRVCVVRAQTKAVRARSIHIAGASTAIETRVDSVDAFKSASHIRRTFTFLRRAASLIITQLLA